MCKNVLEDTGRSIGCCFGSVIDDFKQISVLVLMSCQVNLSKKKKIKVSNIDERTSNEVIDNNGSKQRRHFGVFTAELAKNRSYVSVKLIISVHANLSGHLKL